MSACSTAIGVLALLAGLGELLGITAPLFAVALIVTGTVLVLRPMVARHA